MSHEYPSCFVITSRSRSLRNIGFDFFDFPSFSSSFSLELSSILPEHKRNFIIKHYKINLSSTYHMRLTSVTPNNTCTLRSHHVCQASCMSGIMYVRHPLYLHSILHVLLRAPLICPPCQVTTVHSLLCIMYVTESCFEFSESCMSDIIVMYRHHVCQASCMTWANHVKFWKHDS